MANQTLKTRIRLKYDTLQNWTTNNPVLLAGEIAVVAIPTDSETTVQQVTKPAIVFKVGDGTTGFNTLPYASGLAADVYAWAKAATKPTYTASEVGAATATDITNAINALDVTDSAQSGQYVSSVSQVDGKIQVTRANLPTVNIPEYTLQAGEEDGTIQLMKDGAIVGTAVKVTGFDDLVADIAAKYTKPASGIPLSDLAASVQTSLGKADSAVQSVTEGTENGTISVDGDNVFVHGLGSAAYTASSAYDAAGAATSAVNSHNTSGTAHSDIRSLITGLDGRLDTAESDIDTLQTQIAGLSGAMHYVGDSSTDPTGSSGPTIPSHEGEYQAGDVCTYNQAEYVYDGSEWRLLGDEGSYLTKTEASSTYLTQSAAASTYATQTALSGVQSTAQSAQQQASTNATAIADITDGTTQVGDAAHADAADTATTATNYNTSSGGIKTKFDSVDSAIAAKADPSDITDAINALDHSDSAVSNQYVTAVSETNGIISVTRKQIAYSEISGTPSIPSEANAGRLLGLDGTEIFNANQADDTTIIVIDCGSSSELVD